MLGPRASFVPGGIGIGANWALFAIPRVKPGITPGTD